LKQRHRNLCSNCSPRPDREQILPRFGQAPTRSFDATLQGSPTSSSRKPTRLVKGAEWRRSVKPIRSRPTSMAASADGAAAGRHVRPPQTASLDDPKTLAEINDHSDNAQRLSRPGSMPSVRRQQSPLSDPSFMDGVRKRGDSDWASCSRDLPRQHGTGPRDTGPQDAAGPRTNKQAATAPGLLPTAGPASSPAGFKRCHESVAGDGGDRWSLLWAACTYLPPACFSQVLAMPLPDELRSCLNPPAADPQAR